MVILKFNTYYSNIRIDFSIQVDIERCNLSYSIKSFEHLGLKSFSKEIQQLKNMVDFHQNQPSIIKY